MILLHPRLAAVANIASKESIRYALTSVKITARENNIARIETSDGKRLLRVDYKMPDAGDFPEVPGFKPNGFKTALIHGKTFSEMLKNRKKCKHAPILDHIAVNAEEGTPEREATADSPATEGTPGTVTIATSDGMQHKLQQIRQIDGNYPDTDIVIPTAPPTLSVLFNGKLLAELLQAITAVMADDSKTAVRFDFGGGESAVKLTSKNEDIEATAVIMPRTK